MRKLGNSYRAMVKAISVYTVFGELQIFENRVYFKKQEEARVTFNNKCDLYRGNFPIKNLKSYEATLYGADYSVIDKFTKVY